MTRMGLGNESAEANNVMPDTPMAIERNEGALFGPVSGSSQVPADDGRYSPGYGWLTGSEITKQVAVDRIRISPFAEVDVNPNSYNYHLYSPVRRLLNDVIDMRMPDQFEDLVIPEDGMLLYPHECYLGCTTEEFGSDYYAALITGRSSVGRKFVTNHVTAGLIDQGFYGRITLEITVQRPTRIYPGMAFGQIFWFTSVGTAALYEGKYRGQMTAMSSMAHIDT